MGACVVGNRSDLLGLCKGREAIVTLVPEGGIVVRPEFFVE